ncbi:MAG: hypothetical protein ABI411_08460 [Tahibacter sp.]
MFRFIVFILCLLTVPSLQAQVGLSPQILDITLEHASASWAFRMFNYTKEDKAVKVSAVNWDMDANGNVSTRATTEQSLDGWLVINPTSYVVKAGQSQVIRIAARPAVTLTPGEHRAMVYFDEQPMPSANPEKATLRTTFRFGAAVYGHVGTIDRHGVLLSVETEADKAKLRFSNAGNATTRMSGTFAIWPKAQYPGADKTSLIDKAGTADAQLPTGVVASGRLPTDAVLPGVEREVPLTYSANPLPAGDYMLDLQGSFGDTPIDAGYAFHVDPPKSH